MLPSKRESSTPFTRGGQTPTQTGKYHPTNGRAEQILHSQGNLHSMEQFPTRPGAPSNQVIHLLAVTLGT